MSKMFTDVTSVSFDEVTKIIMRGDSKKLKEIIEAGRVSDVNMLGGLHNRTSLLMVACNIGTIECVRVLLDYDADINYVCKQYVDSAFKYLVHNALTCACLRGNLDLVRFIIERGVVINDGVLSDLFCWKEIVLNTTIASVLVEYIQDVNAKGGTFLNQACSLGNVDIARVLLERGALSGLGHDEALDAAASEGHLDIVLLLLGWSVKDKPQEEVQKACKFVPRPLIRQKIYIYLQYVYLKRE